MIGTKDKEGAVLNHVKWIKSELDKWVRDEIITPEQQALIIGRYEAEASNQLSPVLVLFSVIGALLVGAGIILIFATNWWRMPLPVKLAVAFLPLLLAQGLCVFTALKRWRSAAFREGSTTFLVVAFFATVALVGQVFHIASDLREFIFLCGVFALPMAYLFRSKAALSVYVACAVFASQVWVPFWAQALLLGIAALPLFYMEIQANDHRGTLGYLMLLLSALVCTAVIPAVHAIDDNSAINIALSAALALLLADEAFKKLKAGSFSMPTQLLGSLCIAATIVFAGADFEYTSYYGPSLLAVVPLCALYAWSRLMSAPGFPAPYPFPASDFYVASDLLAVSALLLAIAAPLAGIMANALSLALGIGFIVLGGKQRRVSFVNIGMAFLVLLIAFRFFDSSLSMLLRGIVFILLGVGFLSANVAISRKWRKGT